MKFKRKVMNGLLAIFFCPVITEFEGTEKELKSLRDVLE